MAPYVWADVRGNVGEVRRAVARSGPADLRVRIAMNLLGGQSRPLLGASLVIIARPVSTSLRGSSTSAATAGRSSRRSAWRCRAGAGCSRPRWLRGSIRTTTRSSAAGGASRNLSQRSRRTSVTASVRAGGSPSARLYYSGGRIRRWAESRTTMCKATRASAPRCPRRCPQSVHQAHLVERRHDALRRRLRYLGRVWQYTWSRNRQQTAAHQNSFCASACARSVSTW